MEHSSVLYGICVAVINICWCNSESTNMYLATAHYDKLLPETHEKIMNTLELYVTNAENWLTFLKRFQSRFQKEHEMARNDSSYMLNPLNAFTMFKRLTYDLQLIKEQARTQIEIAGVFADIIENGEADLPNEEDLYGAAVALRRIQATYKLHVKDLAEGTINYDGITHSIPMSANDCYEMSCILYENLDFIGARAWIKEAIRKDKLEKDKNGSLYQIHLDVINKNLNKTSIEEFGEGDKNTWKEQAQLCRNELEVPYDISKRFTCYLTRSSPFLQLAPVKTEQLYIDPDIVMYHDIISDDEIEHLKQLSKPMMDRAEQLKQSNLTRPKNIAEYRSCKNAWIEDRHSKVTAQISRRVRDVTGLSHDYRDQYEKLQVVNYGIGGHYDAHHDFLQDHAVYFQDVLTKKGDRLATVLFYMSNVTTGGATVFIKLGLTVFPIKNAALYWRNLHPSGEGNKATLHAACPVLRGSKWTVTKWIHEHGQKITSSCNLEYQRAEDMKEYPVQRKT